MKILVTGGTGFLGKNLTMSLKERGHDVTVIGRNQMVCAQLEGLGFNIIQADLTDLKMILNSTQNQEIVFHCAALSSPWGKYRDFYLANVVATENIIKSCFKHKVQKLVHISTPSIYFDYRNRRNVSESEPLPLKAVNFYAKTKRLAEEKVDEAFRSGLSTITIRPRGIFGPGDTSILPRLIYAHEKSSLPLFNGGRVLIDMTYIDNVVDALIGTLNAPEIALGKKFNITNDQPMYLIDLLNLLFSKLGKNLRTKEIAFNKAYYFAQLLEWIHRMPFVNKEPPLTKYTVGLLAFDQTLDITTAKNLLNYSPKVSLEAGLDRFVSALKDSSGDI